MLPRLAMSKMCFWFLLHDSRFWINTRRVAAFRAGDAASLTALVEVRYDEAIPTLQHLTLPLSSLPRIHPLGFRFELKCAW